MSQDYHEAGILGFSFERSKQEHEQQIRKNKLRIQAGFEPPLVGMELEDDDESGGVDLPAVYETTAGMLHEMFNNFPASEIILLENGYRIPRTIPPTGPADWNQHRQGIVGNSKNQNINEDSAQLFLMNPHEHQKSPSPISPAAASQNPLPKYSSATLHMLQSSSSNLQAAFHNGQFAWNGNEKILEGQAGLSLSLSSSLMEDGGMFFLGGSHSQFNNILRNSKYCKAAQELLEEFCSVQGPLKKNKFKTNLTSHGNSSSSTNSKHNLPPLSASDRVEHHKRKVKLLSMLDEVDRRYNHYCEQMQMVVNSFDMVIGLGAAVPYTCLAQKAMSRHFRCLKDAISAQIKHNCEVLGDKDAATSGITKGETPRLRILEQSLRQQRAFHHLGIMEQEAWRPQRGLPETSVNILRAWLFEHFLHPYPSDADKHLLARQTGLSRNQVSNWFINARVRLWKPMVEDMYQQESKEESSQRDQSSGHMINNAQITPAKTSQIENDPASFVAINRHTASNSVAALPLPAMLGVNSGDVSLTLGLRHAANLSEKNSFLG
ncbi:BEL1-like homeodomain protein 7 isoform X2 [Henckelia pumila]|uniref:BEL1-like homeodomain protein 7 isoform X2 n=1 Tax=Henckelia pumila TaxID=405737 RepID=UPI003C6E7D70